MSAFAAPPVRFLVAVMALWTGARATALMWEEGVVDPARRGATEFVALDPPKVPAIVAAPEPAVQLAMAEPAARPAIVPAVLMAAAPPTEAPADPAPAEQGSVDPEALLLIASYGGPPQLPLPEPAPAADPQPAFAAPAPVVLALNTIAPVLSEA
ncbi:hypothetical protein [Sphingomonas sanxanigenens]|uniref:Uncharacterized protein n=1 Tax=Sphingomonas sanxanigenens DSM 19645 = NX02 TaxID=1123269 RepID=W0AMY3_9SPHN|nr:hypothetical protein [Sphingomonas sanxanigenens]AHE57050.1 hypothetical protein NX02_27320 [Sphingomonas sanxanigenens DSM 19645 = NX02]